MSIGIATLSVLLPQPAHIRKTSQTHPSTCFEQRSQRPSDEGSLCSCTLPSRPPRHMPHGMLVERSKLDAYLPWKASEALAFHPP